MACGGSSSSSGGGLLLSQHQQPPVQGKTASQGIMSDSSDSDEENVNIAPTFSRKISTNKRANNTSCIKEGYLSLQRSQSFQKWRRRYFWLRGKTLFYGRDKQAEIVEEIDLSEASVAEYTAKNVSHAFQVISTFRNFVLGTESRKDLESWIHAINHAAQQKYYDPNDQQSMMSGMHSWYITSHARPMHCNVCSETLTGVTSHGLSCGVCRFKAHKRCATKAPNNCKWSTLASVGQHIIEEEDGSISMEHQWIEGNLPVSAHCSVCEKGCGSVRRLQDLRCLWCKTMVHSGCKENSPKRCPVSLCRVSAIPPTSIHSIDSDGFCEASRVPGTSPLLVFVNSKSGDNGGVKFLRRFKQLLNPAQVFDLMNGGPMPGLRLFQRFDQFRILICGGDGSIGWVLSELDTLGIHNRCQIGVLPLGTGNDLARVLGWGPVMTDDNQLQSTIEKFEQSQIKMLDRWSVMVYEKDGAIPDSPLAGMPPPVSPLSEEVQLRNCSIGNAVNKYELSVTDHLSKILHSSDHSTVISSARVLCQTVKDFVAEVDLTEQDTEKICSHESLSSKCQLLQTKLNSLMDALDKVSQLGDQVSQSEVKSESSNTGTEELKPTSHAEIQENKPRSQQNNQNESQRAFIPKDLLMSRANSLKKAVRQIIQHTEEAVDMQHAESKEVCRLLSTISSTSSDSQTDSLNRPCVTFDIGTGRARSPSSIDSDPQPTNIPANQQSPARRISSLSTLASATGSETDQPKTAALNPTKVPVNQLRVGNAIANNLSCGSFISKMLLANADTLCAPVAPQFDDQYLLSLYDEKCVMNNYFGIGIDAKIALEFHQQREEHPERFRSRARNLMTFVGLGGREMISQTYKHFKQRIQLECDGHRLPLPDLQGIVVLNIPSYSGGTNFWGSHRHNSSEPFQPPSFDDKILEVMAVYSSAHIGMSRIVNLQYHRIAQCRTVKITILGDEPVPVQVDGEAWTQNPGMVIIQHKNRAQMLTRDRSFESTLRSWSERQIKESKSGTNSPKIERRAVDDATAMKSLVDATRQLIDCLTTMNLPALAPTEAALGKIGEFVTLDDATQFGLKELSVCSRELCGEVQEMLSHHTVTMKAEQESAILKSALHRTQEELSRYASSKARPEESHRSRQGPFKLIGKLKGKSKKSSSSLLSTGSQGEQVSQWDTDAVATWLVSLGCGEYADIFIRNDIRGPELLLLQRNDLKDLGVSKVGHLKRIQSGLKTLIQHQEKT